MAGRIITMQRQARELGRLRSGYTDTSGAKPQPVKSETWILSSHDVSYIEAAAELWGGKPEKWQPMGNGSAQWRVITGVSSIDAILPPGDPLSQHYEMFSKGGCTRRCTGAVELLTDTDCKCISEFGSDFHLQPKDRRCQPTSRLALILPAMPDLGTWRAESRGFYAANEIAAVVDVIRGATGGNSMVPVQLRIEPRTRISEGKTKHYPVITLGLRGVTAGQILSGTSPGLALNSNGSVNLTTGEITTPKAIESAPSNDCDVFVLRTLEARDAETVRIIWREASEAGCIDTPVTIEGVTKSLRDVLTIVGRGFADASKPEVGPTPPAPTHPLDNEESMSDRVAVWTQCLAASNGTTDSTLAEWYSFANGIEPAEGTIEQLRGFLAHVRTAAEAPPVADEKPALDQPGF